MHEFWSSLTSYGIAAMAVFFTQDMAAYAAFFGLILVIVRIIGDIPRAISSWKELFKKEDDDGSDNE